MRPGEQTQQDPALEEYLKRHESPLSTGNIEILDGESEGGFYKLKGGSPDTGTAEEEVFLNSLTGDLLRRRVRWTSPYVQTVELTRVDDHRSDLKLSRYVNERRDFLRRKKVDITHRGSYRISEQAGRGKHFLTGNYYDISYENGQANKVKIQLNQKSFGDEDSTEDGKPQDLEFNLEKNQLVFGETFENKKEKAPYGQVVTIGPTKFVVTPIVNGQREVSILVGDGLIRTISFAANVDMAPWFSSLNEMNEPEEWIKKSQQFPAGLGVATDPNSIPPPR